MSQTQSNCVVHMDINTIELCDVDRHTIELRYEHNPFEFFGVPKDYKIWKDCERNVFEQGLFRLGCTKATKDAAAGKLDGLSHM